MSTLSSAMDTAKSSLLAAQTQTSIVSRNIANANTVGATAKIANAVTGISGRVQISSISQSSNSVLFRNMLDANSAVGRGNVISNGLDRINDTLGDTALSRSPASLISAFGSALSSLAASPNNYELARTAATAANDVVTSLNDASLTVQSIRRDADTELVNAAAEMTSILAKIQDLNTKITAGTRAGNDITDFSDQRDQQVVALSSYVGLTSQIRGDNNLVLYTDSGATLFETTARSVTYSATNGLNETVSEGNAFRIDGTPVTGSTAYLPLKSGSVAGLVALRDDVMGTYQTQIDEIARGLVETFKETAPDGSIAAGLFTASGITGTATVSVGTFDAASVAAGDTMRFDFVAGDKTYRATLAFTAAPGNSEEYRTLLQNAVNAATPVAGGAALGAGTITVGNDAGAISFTSERSGILGLTVSNISVNSASKTGGLTAAASASGTASTPATISAGSFAAGTIAKGDALSFTFSYDGTTYTAKHTFTSVPADAAAFRQVLATAMEAATNASGTALGTGKIAVGGSGSALTISTVDVGAGKSLSLSNVVGDPSADGAHTGGLVAGVSTSHIVGLANALKIGAGVIADPTKIRDGVVTDFNTANSGGFTLRLNAMTDALTTARGFSVESGADPSATLADYAASSISWLQATRSASSSETEYKATLLDQTQQALSDSTGINMDEQLTKMIEIERSYQASSKLISTIDEMLQTLISSI